MHLATVKQTVPWLPDLAEYHPEGELCGKSIRMLQRAQSLVRERPRTESELGSAMRICPPLVQQIISVMSELGMLWGMHVGRAQGLPRLEFTDRTRPN